MKLSKKNRIEEMEKTIKFLESLSKDPVSTQINLLPCILDLCKSIIEEGISFRMLLERNQNPEFQSMRIDKNMYSNLKTLIEIEKLKDQLKHQGYEYREN